MLKELAGRWHRVYTGLTLVALPGGREWSAAERTEVKMRRLSPQDLLRLAPGHLDKAGAYAAQARGNPFVERYRGDFDNVVGLPLRELRALLAKARRAGFIPIRK